MKISADGETDTATIKSPMQVFMLLRFPRTALTSPHLNNIRGVRCAHSQQNLQEMQVNYDSLFSIKLIKRNLSKFACVFSVVFLPIIELKL